MVSVSKYLKDTEDTVLMYLNLYLRYISKVYSPTLCHTDYGEDGESAALGGGGARRALLSGQPSTSSSLPTYDAVANNGDDDNEWKWDAHGRR